MSQKQSLNRLLRALAMKSPGNAPPWSAEHAEFYEDQLLPWEEDLLDAVTERVNRHICTWRPDVASLYAMAAEIAAPVPPEYRLRRELTGRAFERPKQSSQLFVENGVEYARFDRPAPILWSHPVLTQIVEELDGLPAVRARLDTATNRDQRDFERAFHAAYERAAAAWRFAVIEELAKPAEARDPSYFSDYPAWSPAPVLRVPVEVPARTEERPLMTLINDIAQKYTGGSHE